MISEAFASSALPTKMSGVGSLFPFILIFAVFYLLLIRPQQKKMKEHENMIKNLKVGDKVSTDGGIIGRITNIDTEKNIITLKITKDHAEVELLSHAVTNVIRGGDVDDSKLLKGVQKKKKE